jgi:hypothetical protein
MKRKGLNALAPRLLHKLLGRRDSLQQQSVAICHVAGIPPEWPRGNQPRRQLFEGLSPSAAYAEIAESAPSNLFLVWNIARSIITGARTMALSFLEAISANSRHSVAITIASAPFAASSGELQY